MHVNRSRILAICSDLCLAGMSLLIVGGVIVASAQSSLPKLEDYKSNRFDSSDKLKVTGPILEVDAAESGAIIWMRAATVMKQEFGSRPGYNEGNGIGVIWRVEGPGVAKIKDRAVLTPGAEIVVTGANSTDKSCKPTCRIKSAKSP